MKVISSVSLLFSLANSHSWLHCSDYDATINGQDFDESSCNGYIRSWDEYASTAFADDRGVNYQPNGAWCPKTIGDPDDGYSSTYSSGSPMAQWTKGEEITLVWPAKNHANYECFANIPDNSMKLYYNPTVNPDADPTFTSTPASNDWTLLIDWQEDCTPGTDGCGFQNCPDFCANTDGAPCFGEYTVSREHFPEPGFYTLLWYWIFNPGTPYTTCFEVFIDGTPAPTAPTTPSAPSSTPSPTPANNDDDGSNNNDDDNNNNNDDDNGNNDGNTGNTDTGNGADSSDDDVIIYDYLVLIPICYTGATYDENTLLDGAHNVNYESSTEVDWMVLTVEDDGGEDWNATIQTHTNSASDVTLTSYSYATDSSQLCEAIEDEFGTGTCEICDPGAMRTYSFIVTSDDDDGNDTLNKNSDEEGENWWIWLVVALIGIILILLTGISVYVCMKRKENGGGSSIQSNKNMNEFGLTNVMTTNTQAIRAVSDDHDDDQHVTGMPQYNQYNSNSPPTGHGRPNGAPPRPPPPPRR